ncbi:MAG: hypothetical protein SWZ49_32600 [Cyanobacteriota bacterium]|nr:hypothetical protein [Cyanobacteriota bacterium]
MSVSREDFEIKINQVGENLYFSHFHLKIHESMTKALNNHFEEYPPFFDWSRMAHYEAGILRLTRAYDKNSLGLLKIIKILQSEYRFWGLPDILDAEQLEQDKIFVTPENELIDGLIHLRDKVISHTDNKLYPKKLNIDIQNIYGGELIYRAGKITTEEIENLPKEEKERRLNRASNDFFLAVERNEGKILGKQVPSFHQFYELTHKGVEICNRYMQKLGIALIELKLEGID